MRYDEIKLIPLFFLVRLSVTLVFMGISGIYTETYITIKNINLSVYRKNKDEKYFKHYDTFPN